MIEASPFAVLATSGTDGLDASPRGDAPGFVRIVDEKTLMLPERRGNNRVDGLHNILHDPRIALLFLIPGVGFLRVNGRAEISVDRIYCSHLRSTETTKMRVDHPRRISFLSVRSCNPTFTTVAATRVG